MDIEKKINCLEECWHHCCHHSELDARNPRTAEEYRKHGARVENGVIYTDRGCVFLDGDICLIRDES